MAAATKTIVVTPETDLRALLDDAADGPQFRLGLEEADDLWADYDPERVRTALREVARSMTREEGERIKELIYRGREEGTRPPDRP